MTTTGVKPTFVRKERLQLEVLQQRLDHLQGDHPERSGDPAYPPGESQALAWAISVLLGEVEPVDVRLARIEQTLRVHGSRLGRIEAELDEGEV